MLLRNGKHIHQLQNIEYIKILQKWTKNFLTNKYNRHRKDLCDIKRLKQIYPHLFANYEIEKRTNKKSKKKTTKKSKKRTTKNKKTKNKKTKNKKTKKVTSDTDDENDYDYNDGWLINEESDGDYKNISKYDDQDILNEITQQYKKVQYQGSKYTKGIRKSQRRRKHIEKYMDPDYIKIILEDSKIEDIFQGSITEDSNSDSEYSEFENLEFDDSDVETNAHIKN